MVELLAMHPEGIDKYDLMDLIYADERNGGPLSTNIIAVMVKQANKQLRPQGYEIKSTQHGGRGALWLLKEIENARPVRQPSKHIHARAVERSEPASAARRD